jgi:uncharacterized OB-fold protein
MRLSTSMTTRRGRRRPVRREDWADHGLDRVKCFRCGAAMEKITPTRAVCSKCRTRAALFPITTLDQQWLKQRGKWSLQD